MLTRISKIICVTWPNRSLSNLYPGRRVILEKLISGSAGKIFATMLLHL